MEIYLEDLQLLVGGVPLHAREEDDIQHINVSVVVAKKLGFLVETYILEILNLVGADWYSIVITRGFLVIFQSLFSIIGSYVLNDEIYHSILLLNI